MNDQLKAWFVIFLTLTLFVVMSIWYAIEEQQLNDAIANCLAQGGTPVIVPKARWVAEMKQCVLP
jgi:hypothetical protein